MSDHHVPATGHEDQHGTEVATFGDPLPDPGLPAHEPRPTDVDPHAARRAERQIAGLFGLVLTMWVWNSRRTRVVQAPPPQYPVDPGERVVQERRYTERRDNY